MKYTRKSLNKTRQLDVQIVLNVSIIICVDVSF